MQLITASIITIGDELLIGQVIDTNSAWMAQELNRIGVTVSKRVAVGDTWQAIWQALDQEMEQSDIILITGGLGPTADDITKPLLCEYFGGELVIDQAVLQHVTYLFETVLKRPMIERNRRQAEVPNVCTVLHNARGTAPGMWFEKNGKVIVSLPGVPVEMKGIMTDEVLARLKKQFQLPVIYHRTLLTAGLGESFLAERIRDFEEHLPPAIKLAYLPNYGMVRLRLSAAGYDADWLQSSIDEQFILLQEQLADVLVTNKDERLDQVVANMLLERGETVGTTESCTGGHIAQVITSVAGSSRYFKGSIVSYDNEVKKDLLRVPASTLETQGAVSQATVEHMVRGGLNALKTDYVIATSGIMGPGGGSPDKPVGTVWIAVGDQQNIVSQVFKFRFNRQRNIELAATQAFNLLRLFILQRIVREKTNGH